MRPDERGDERVEKVAEWPEILYACRTQAGKWQYAAIPKGVENRAYYPKPTDQGAEGSEIPALVWLTPAEARTLADGYLEGDPDTLDACAPIIERIGDEADAALATEGEGDE